MSTVSGVFPNAITPTFAQSTDPAEQARLRRENETVAFAPIEETEAASPSRRLTVEQPGRLEAELATNAAYASQGSSTSEAAQRSEEEVRDTSSPVQETSRQTQSEDQQQTAQERQEQQQLTEELVLIRELAARDREVRNHEQAHASVGGDLAGAAEFVYETGPDGKRYATSGEVSIDISKVPGDPEATLEKADRVRRAALAPAEPSAQDLQVAALATQIELEARTELRSQERAEAAEAEEARSEQQETRAAEEKKSEQANAEEDNTAEADAERLDEILRRTAETVAAALEAAYQTQSADEIGFNLDTTV